ncbi:MAG: acyl-CoA thioesterase [Bacteriovoracaceae bacterium]|nr:acyl-CoA thioesterase [Bacteriovoracaceae bacterium]
MSLPNQLHLTPKSPKESMIEMREMVLPQHTNALNTIFGGVVMSWIDLAAAMSAQKHCNRHVVTAHIDEISFLSSIKVGEHVLIKASVNYVGRTSLIVGVRVESEDILAQTTKITTRAYLTFVALDLHGHPVQVPPLNPETHDEKRRFENAKKRVQATKELRAKIQMSNRS